MTDAVFDVRHNSMTDGVAFIAPRRAPRAQGAIAAALGNALEWYDFTIYAALAIYIARDIFPDANETAALIKTFMAFGVGFIARPLGAIVMGGYADRMGRKPALQLSLLIMAAGTLVLATTPSYAAIGIGAPLLVLAGRLLQGFSAGAEIGGAATFIVEQAPPSRIGWYSSWLQASTALSMIMSAIMVYTATHYIGLEQLEGGGWRVAFIVGLLIAPLAFWLRLGLSESPQRSELLAMSHLTTMTRVCAVFSERPKEMGIAFAMSALWSVSVYVLLIYMPIHAQQAFGFSPAQAAASSVVGGAILGISCLAFGALGDRIGLEKVLSSGALTICLGVVPLMWLLQQNTSFPVLVGVQALMCVGVGMYSATAPAALVALFPPALRATGLAISYNSAVVIFGGFAPAVLTILASSGGSTLAPAFYVAIVAFGTLVAIRRLVRQGGLSHPRR